MRQLRTRLIVAFLAATILPLSATILIAMTLLDRSLAYSTTDELDRLSRTLEGTVRQFYQGAREALKRDAAEGRVEPTRYVASEPAHWPAEVRAFWDSGEPERFVLSGTGGDQVDYLLRDDGGVRLYRRPLPGVHMQELSAQVRDSRTLVGSLETRDLRRGFTLTLLLLLAIVWVVSLAPLVFIAHRISRPVQDLTAGLAAFAEGDWDRRIASTRDDEVGRAVGAFNHMAEQLQQNRERLVQLTQLASWQSLARKTAHEVKNSLTPIRLTVEEMLARHPPGENRAFMDQAAQIVVSEIDSLERRVRAFSEFASEPPIHPGMLDLNAVVTERLALLGPAHASTLFEPRLDAALPEVWADPDLIKGILTNLLQNAADAAGHGGTVRVTTTARDDQVVVDVSDSGPGVGDEAAATLFEPTITFKKHGMGLGLSIAKKNALLSGGDIALVKGELAGACFRLTLPCGRRTS